ncbi:MAG: hypothetical protein J7J06_00435 [Methanosarcinales archaeon]|nr:hypothetical protein [Methanosarcinales archaeon]
MWLILEEFYDLICGVQPVGGHCRQRTIAADPAGIHDGRTRESTPPPDDRAREAPARIRAIRGIRFHS